MKSLIFINFLIFVSLLCSCQQCKKDEGFKFYYNTKIKKIVDYDKKCTKIGVISTADWMEFYDNTEYLSRLTNCPFRFAYGEPPMYKNYKDLFLDVQFLKQWYENNKCEMTIQKADSIVMETYCKPPQNIDQ